MRSLNAANQSIRKQFAAEKHSFKIILLMMIANPPEPTPIPNPNPTPQPLPEPIPQPVPGPIPQPVPNPQPQPL
jgi:outer membrane biosynthesis protein TonB